MAKNYYGGLHDAFHNADNSMQLTPQGSGGYELHPETLAPQKTRKMSIKPQSPAQHEAVEKAGRTSAVKRSARAGKAFVSTKPTGLL